MVTTMMVMLLILMIMEDCNYDDEKLPLIFELDWGRTMDQTAWNSPLLPPLFQGNFHHDHHDHLDDVDEDSDGGLGQQ